MSTMVNSERSIQFLNAAPEAISESWDRPGQKEKGCVAGKKTEDRLFSLYVTALIRKSSTQAASSGRVLTSRRRHAL